MFPRTQISALLLAASAGLTGCGAGVISGAILGSDGGGSGPVAPFEPSITLSVNRGPLDIAPGERFEAAAVLSNIDVPVSSQVFVDLVVLDQPDVVERQVEVEFTRSTNDTIRWRLVTDQIRTLFSDLTAQDVPVLARMTARGADGRLTVLGEAPFTLLRKRVARIDDNGVVIPITGGIVTLTVTPRLAGSPQVEVQGVPAVTTVASLESREDDVIEDFTRIRVAIPAGDTPQELGLVVIDRDAGRSTIVHNVFYAPRLTGVTDRSGSSDGDDRLSIVGAGLIPLDFSVPGDPEPELDRVELVFRKGPREVVVGSIQLTGSSPSALTLRSPGSPDGHPGPVAIEVRVRVPRIDGSGGTRIVSDEAEGLYAYAASLPSFEPRGIAIQESPLDIDFGALTLAPGEATAGEAAVLFADAIDGVGLVRVLTGDGHGMLRRIGRFVSAGEPVDVGLQGPIDLCIGDYVDDEFFEVIVGHLGTGQAFSRSTLLRNGESRRGLLLDFEHLFDVDRNTRELTSVDLDQDGHQDVFIGAILDAGLALSSFGPAPVWFRTMFPTSFPFGAFAVAQPIDLESDGQMDVVCVVRTNRDDMTTVRYRNGALHAFGPFPLDDLVGISGRTTHAVPLGRPGDPPRVGLVVETAPAPLQDFRLLVVELSPRGRPTLLDSLQVPREADGSVFLVSRTLAGDFDGDGRTEWAIASESHGLRIYEHFSGSLRLESVEPTFGDEPVGKIHSLDFAPVSETRNALYVTHDVGFDTINETRVTTALVADDGSLISAKARFEFEPEDSIRQMVTLDPAGHRVAALLDGVLAVFDSDEFGQLTEGASVVVGDLLPSTMRRVDLNGRTAVTYLDRGGRVGLLLDGESSVRLSPFEFLSAIGDGTQVLTDASRVDAGDFDGDGVQDLVVLGLVGDAASAVSDIGGEGGEPQIGVVLLRGRISTDSAEFPFELTHVGLRTDLGSPTSIAAGDFAFNATPADELAVAIPSQGIRFFAWLDGQFVSAESDSQRPAVSEGRSPDLVRAVDLDQDGIDDLAALSLTRSVVRVYLQQDPRLGKVNVAGYIFADESPIPPGVRADLEPVDVDGDDLLDLVVAVVGERGQPTVGALLWDGTDRLRRVFTVPSARVSGEELSLVEENRTFSFTIADTNHDGTSDIVIGWARDPNPKDGRVSFLHTLFGSRR